MVIQNFGSHKSTLTVHRAPICFNKKYQTKTSAKMKSNQKYDDGMKKCTSGKCVFPTKNTIRDRGCIAPLTPLIFFALFILFSFFKYGYIAL